MSGLCIQLDRLNLALHGVSADMAQALSDNLERALTERVGRLGGEPLSRADLALGGVSLGTIEATAGLDGAALAGIVAERLVEMLALRAGMSGRGGES